MSHNDIYLIIPFSQQNNKERNIIPIIYGYINMGKVDTSTISLQKFTISFINFNTSNKTKLTATVVSNNVMVNNKTATLAHGNYMPFLTMFKTAYAENKEIEINELYLMKKESIPKPIKIIKLI
jgi:hypothetical protein